MSGYYRQVLAAKPQIEAVTGRCWTIPNLAEFSHSLEARESLALPELPGYEFLAYLRHIGFPSPLLDWTRSPYIAAFFAFSGASARHEGAVAIYAYLEWAGRAERHMEPHIATTGPRVPTHVRHFLQQSDYSICSVRDKGEWHFASHEDAPRGRRESMLKLRFLLLSA
jgi:hypothetical protein